MTSIVFNSLAGLTSAFTCCRKKKPTFQNKMRELRQKADEEYTTNFLKMHVVIIGGGPCGLVRAIQSLLLGFPTTVIEKRSSMDIGRENAVQLSAEAIEILKEFGVWDYLLENKLIHTPSDKSLIVRVGDLEKALKEVINSLSDEPVIRYDSTVEKSDSVGRLTIRSGNRREQIQPGLLYFADGARSSTARRLCDEKRVEILPKVPVVAAIFQDRTYSFRDPCRSAKNVMMAVKDDMRHAYYMGLFACKTLFQGEHVFNKKRQITGSLILPTPGQNYLGFSLNKTESEILSDKNRRVQDCQQQLKVAEQEGNAEKIEIQKGKLTRAKASLQSALSHWSHLAFCQANTLAFLSRILRSKSQFQWAWWKPLDLEKTAVFEIGPDQDSRCSGMISSIPYLKGGDALATVDPVTGLGCTTAIHSVTSFKIFLLGLQIQKPLDSLQDQYDKRMTFLIKDMHENSKMARQHYRPDTITTLPK